MEEGVYLNASQRAIIAARMANQSRVAHKVTFKMLQLKHQFPRRKQRDG